jgi:hypothetical protein
VQAAAATGPSDRVGSDGDRRRDFGAARRWEMDKVGENWRRLIWIRFGEGYNRKNAER